MTIKRNTKEILERVSNAANKSGRSLDDVTIISVTKTVGIDKINEVVSNGIINLGENRVQEFNNKFNNLLNNNVKWHMIGHLQTNKVKYIIDKIELIHSVESIKLAKEINKKAQQKNITAKVLIELNIGEEDSKYGISEDNIIDLLKQLEKLNNIKIYGLMTVAPYCENPEDVRWVFQKMKAIYDNISNMKFKNTEMKYLSMGMTNDFEIAIEEGANMVRIGTGFFGERNY